MASKTRVYVVAQNDFPDSVFTTQEAAEKYMAKKREQKAQSVFSLGARKDYWHVHELELRND